MLLCLADALIVYYRWPFVFGLALCGTERAFGVGGFTGFVLIGLGAFGGCFCQWRTEPGLWMLSALFMPIFGLPWAVLGVAAILDLMRQDPLTTAEHSVDFALGISLLGPLVVFLMTVTWVNWELKGKRKTPTVDEF